MTDSTKKRRASWRKQPSETGLRSIGQGPRGYELRIAGDDVIIRVQAAGGSATGGPLRGWYWYGMDVNTYNTKTLFKTAEEAKADADAFYKDNKDKA